MKLNAITLLTLLFPLASPSILAQPTTPPGMHDWQPDPQMMEQMMQHRQSMMGREMGPDYRPHHHQMREQMRQHRQKLMERRGDGGMMPGGRGMDPDMMEQMRAQRMQHMRSMEQRLERIEALLQQLVEQQKQ